MDFNGDGRVDLVGGFADRVEFRPGDGRGAFPAGFTTQSFATGDVAVGRLDSDVCGDVLQPTSEGVQGIAVWRGQTDGPPLPTAYAAVDVPFSRMWSFMLRYPRLAPQGAQVVVYEVAGTGVAARVVPPIQKEVIVDREGTLDALGDGPAIADLDSDGNDDIVFGFTGANTVKVYRVRLNILSGDLVLGGWDSLDEPTEVDVSQPWVSAGGTNRRTGFQIQRGVLVADVDADGHLDLLVSVANASTGVDGVVVALGDGRGAFGDPYFDDRFAALSLPQTVPQGSTAGEPSQWPIAAGDLNEDGFADFVSPDGVFLANTAPPHDLTETDRRGTGDPWTNAAITDVDGDGRADVAAISRGKTVMEVLRCFGADTLCTETGLFSHRPYYTKFGIAKLRAARLQALASTDLVLIEQGPEGSGEDDVLSAMYSSPGNWPDAPVRQARFHHIDQVALMPGSIEGISVSTIGRDGKASLGFLSSAGTRQLGSTFPLVSYPGPKFSTAVQVLPGHFLGTEQLYEDLVLLGRSPADEPGAWWVPGREDAAFGTSALNLGLDPLLADFRFDCARFTVGDSDGDGRDELVGVTGHAVCPARAKTLVAVGRASAASFSFDVRELPITESVDTAVDGDTSNVARARVALSDLDGDGMADLVVAREGNVSVFSGSASGLVLDETRFDLPAGEAVLGITEMARSHDARGPSRAVVLTKASLMVVSAAGTSKIASVSALGLRSADVDGDGLGDLLLLGKDGMELLFTVPAPPLGGRP